PVTRSAELLITFDLPLTEKLSLEESLGLITKQGYQRLLLPRRRAAATPPPTLELNENQAHWGTTQTPAPPTPPGRPLGIPAATPVQFPSREGATTIELTTAVFSPLPSVPGQTTGSGLKTTPHFPRTPPRSTTVREASEAGRAEATHLLDPQFEIIRIDEAVGRLKQLNPKFLTVVQDRVKL